MQKRNCPLNWRSISVSNNLFLDISLTEMNYIIYVMSLKTQNKCSLKNTDYEFSDSTSAKRQKSRKRQNSRLFYCSDNFPEVGLSKSYSGAK